MSENQLRVRFLSNQNTSTNSSVHSIDTQLTSNQTKHTLNTMSSSDTTGADGCGDRNHTYHPMVDTIDDDIDDRFRDNECTDDDDEDDTNTTTKRFPINHQKQDIIDLLYSDDVIRYSKTTNTTSGGDRQQQHLLSADSSDEDNDPFDDRHRLMKGVINDRRPLLDGHSSPKSSSMAAIKKYVKSKRNQQLLDSPYHSFDGPDDGQPVTVVTAYDESLLSLYFQVFVPFLIAGFGTVGAGLVLDYVQHWEVFRQVSEVFILVPALLGLKGNLEMTLASRLSTQANLGRIDSGREQWLITSGNIALIQATIVAFLAAVFAITMDWLPEGEFNMSHALLLCASSLLTASIASFLLGLLMIVVVIVSHKCHINPDNVATPIAASLGDLTTLALFAQFSDILYYTVDTNPWLCCLVIAMFLLLVPVWCYIAKNNKYTQEVLYNGWTPVISAMAISSIGGCILDFAVARFKGIAVFQPVINGVGGNLVAVQASRISTHLHQTSKLGQLPKSGAKVCFNPCATFFSKTIHARTARVLLMMVIPGHLVFTYGIRFLKAGHTSVTVNFLLIYLLAAFIQVVLLLYFAHTMVLWMWQKSIDPDNSAIPYLTALGDLLGTALLALAFVILFSMGDRDSDVGD